MKSSKFVHTLCLCLTTFFAISALQAAETDEKWEMTTKMDMAGMSMPATTVTSCQPKGGYKPDAGPAEQKCQITDVKNSGNTFRWKMQCSGKEAMTGNGQITRTATTMDGRIEINSQGMNMVQLINGRLIGTCDAAAERGKFDKQIKGQMKQACEQQTETAWKYAGPDQKMPSLLAGKECPGAKVEVCSKAKSYAGSYEGYGAYSASKGWVIAECGINVEVQRRALCGKAGTDKQYGFLNRYCPTEAKALSEKYCQGFGRSYTSDTASPNAELCRGLRNGNDVNNASDDRVTDSGNQAGGTAKAKESSASQDNAPDMAGQAMDAAKKLKGLFGF